MIDTTRIRRSFVAALIAGLTVRIVLISTTLGTSDILYWRLWYSLIDEHGILAAYRFHSELNHPPLSLLILLILGRVGDALGILVSEPLRTLQVISDIITTFCLLGISQHARGDENGLAPLFFLLSPIAILISSFHGNTDSLMIALLVAAVLATVRTSTPGWVAGLLLAASVGIKIVPLVLVPFFWSAVRGRRTPFSVMFLTALTVIFAPGVWVSGSAFVRNVFGYAPTSMKWGIVGLLRGAETGWSSAIVEVWTTIGTFAIAAAALAIWAFRRKRVDSSSLPAYLAITLLLFLAIAPGAGLRYLLWPLPFVPYLFTLRESALFHLVGSIGLGMVYTIWSKEFPWFFATPLHASPFDWLVPWVGLIVWLMVLALSVSGLRGLLFSRDADSEPRY